MYRLRFWLPRTIDPILMRIAQPWNALLRSGSTPRRGSGMWIPPVSSTLLQQKSSDSIESMKS